MRPPGPERYGVRHSRGRCGGTMMQVTTISAEGLGIEGLRDRIEGWRQNAPKSRAMPEELWTEASAAAKRLGACRVARALGLNYDTLKQRVLAGDANQSRGAACEGSVGPTGTQFIELTGFPAVSHTAAGDEVVIEVLASDGARLTIRLKRADVDVAGLVKAFRRRL